MIAGRAGADAPMPLHVHVECLGGDVFGSLACGCGAELAHAVAAMRAEGTGMIIYLRPPTARACGLLAGSAAPDMVSETVAWILRDLGVYTVRLSDDAPELGLLMFGAIREHGLHVESSRGVARGRLRHVLAQRDRRGEVMTHPDLAGKKSAIVTGAGAGIGLAIAKRLAAEGCQVLCADINGDSALAAASELGGDAVGHRVDVSDEAQVIGMVEACVAAFGGVDKLVANAGVVHFAPPLLETRVDDFDRVIGINLRGAWLCTKHTAPLAWSSAVVAPSSTCPRLADKWQRRGTAAYGMSKAGIIHLSRITAAELRSANVRSNALLPAFVDTPPMQQTAMTMFDEALGAGGASTMIGRLQGRMAGPDEMAGVVAFLLSDDASMIDGTAQVADGGTLAALW